MAMSLEMRLTAYMYRWQEHAWPGSSVEAEAAARGSRHVSAGWLLEVLVPGIFCEPESLQDAWAH